MTSSTLELDKDGTFYYHLDAEWSEGFSRGKWKRIESGIELKRILYILVSAEFCYNFRVFRINHIKQ